MRHLAVGDIHGCYSALVTLAQFVPFQTDDVVITLGDYVDRGPNSCAVLDWLIHYRRRRRLVALRGNHEIMMERARLSRDALVQWIESGGNATLHSYSPFGDSGDLVDVPDSHWHFLERDTVSWYQVDRHFFVHANAHPDCSLEDQPEFLLYWESFNNPRPHVSGKIMVCGHTPQESGKPLSIGHAVCIDTGACRGNWLTCLDVDSGRYWQANEQHETRLGWIASAIDR